MSTEIIKETINSEIEAVSLNIPLIIKMFSSSSEFEFKASIDELGRIVLTPISKDTEFTFVNIIDDESDSISNSEEITEASDNISKEKQFKINLTASMLAEDSNLEIDSCIDEIGQVLITPLSENNVFVTASFQDSLNLVTEDLQTVDYFGYKLVNVGDGWNIYDYTNQIVEEGVATLHEAKIVVCTTELHRLEELTEDMHNKPDSTSGEDSEKDHSELSDKQDNNDAVEDEKKIETPKVTAEVIDESFSNVPAESQEMTRSEIKSELEKITSNFSEEQGAVKCDTISETTECENILKQHYSEVITNEDDSVWKIIYYGPTRCASKEECE